MSYQSLLTVWDARPESLATFETAVRLARENDAHLNVLCLGLEYFSPGFYYPNVTPEIFVEGTRAAQQSAEEFEESAAKKLQNEGIKWSTQREIAPAGSIRFIVSNIACFYDLALLPQPYAMDDDGAAASVLEAVLFEGNAPVLVHPRTPVADFGKNIVVAWNESREALDAIRASLPFLAAAERVNVVVIEPEMHGEKQADPGSELGKLLSRHGASVEVSIIPRTIDKVSDVLDRFCMDKNADMLVMGAYSHSRLRENILGGVTRDVLRNVKIPVLMAH